MNLTRCLSVLLFGLMMLPSVSRAYAQDTPSKVSKNDFKMTMLSIGSGSHRFTYERALSPRNSAEITMGIVGWGFDMLHDADPRGLLLKGAYKWTVFPQKRAASWLAGFFLKPELLFADFDYSDNSNKAVPTREHTRQWALLGEFGYQFVFGWFSLELYAGLGPSIGTGNSANYYHSYMLFPADGHLAMTSGYKVGVAF